MLRHKMKLQRMARLFYLLLLCGVIGGGVTIAHAEGGYNYATQWGTLGNGLGQFNRPVSIAIDKQGNLYIADMYNHRIQKFNSNGTYVTQWGTFGAGQGQFSSPSAVAVDSRGYVYVADSNNYRIQQFNSNGSYLTQWGSLGAGDGQFFFPSSVSVDSNGNVFVITNNQRTTLQFNVNASWDNQSVQPFTKPYGVTVDVEGNIYVVDYVNHRIRKFNRYGGAITQWGSRGSGVGQFQAPEGIAVDSQGNVYIADTGNHRIQKFTSTTPISSNTYLSKLDGISANAHVGDRPLIAGILISGGTKRVMVRASSVEGVLDPSVEIFTYPDRKSVAKNDAWTSHPTAAELTANKLTPARSTDAAMILELSPGLYTAEVTRNTPLAGLGIVEVYDMNVFTGMSHSSQFGGISANAYIGDKPMISGILISGGTKRLMVRASSVDGMIDPSVEVFSYPDRQSLGRNDAWTTDPLIATELTAKQFVPARNTDAAMILELPPGLYTAEVTRTPGTTNFGAGILEVYDID